MGERKIEQQAHELQKEAENNTTKPLWNYINLEKSHSRDENTSIYQENGA